MKRHRGHSMIELLTAISAGTAVMAIAVGLLTAMLDMDRHARERAQQRTALDRLADQFRRDVHAALGVKPLGAPAGDRPARTEPAGWQFELEAGQSVEYRAAANGELVRTERTGAKEHGTESHRLPPQTVAAIQLDQRAEPRAVTLRLIAKEASTTKPAHRALRVDAVLGTNHRFRVAKGT